jgi:DNA-binding LacI/PurR family transcriptional regulator
MKSGKKRATIRDIAQLAKTSVATVSWVINGDSRKYVSDELKERVQQAAKTLNYHPNLLAQRLKGKSRKLLAIIVPQFENIFFNRIVIGAEKYANTREYKLLICTTDNDFHKEAEIVNQLIANWVDGFLITPTLEGKKSVDAIVQSGVPLVLMDCISEADIDYVAVDNRNTASLAAKFLFLRGHRRIAYIGWDTGFESILNRSAGFFEGLNELGVSREEIVFMRCSRSAEAGYMITDEILKKHKPTAFFIDQNNIAEGVVRALRERKLNIPGDVSLLLYGDPSWARLNVPEFTAVNLPDVQIGAEAARILIDKLEGRHTDVQKVLLKGHLAIRGSVMNLKRKAL